MAVNNNQEKSYITKNKNTDDMSIRMKSKPNEIRVVLPTSNKKPIEVAHEIDKSEAEEAGSKKKITITVDADDPCLKKDQSDKDVKPKPPRIPTLDPRFQQQNQTLRCYVMYTDFYRCERILGEGSEACIWFKDVFRTICPSEWIRRWDEYRAKGIFPWHKHRTQGEFPGDKYGV